MERGKSLMGFTAKGARTLVSRSKGSHEGSSIATTRVAAQGNEKDILSQVLLDLRARDDSSREKATADLRAHISQQARDMSSENFKKFGKTFSHNVVKLINGTTPEEKIAAIMCIDCLMDVDFDDNAQNKITRLSNYLHQLLGAQDQQVLVLASACLGKLVRAEGTLTAEIVDNEMRSALEVLRDEKSTERRHAAALVLKELALNAPSLFYVQVANFFDVIWVGMQDAHIQIRESSIEALKAALILVQERKSRQRAQWYDTLWQRCLLGLKPTSVDSTHGSLLAIGELLVYAGEFMSNRVKEICDTMLKNKDFKNDKSGLIRRTVISLIPVVAKFAPQDFVNEYLDVFMNFLFDVLKNSKDQAERGAAFLAVGNIAKAISRHKTRLCPYLPQVIILIKSSLQAKKSYCDEALTCISSLARSLKSDFKQNQAYELLPLMFQAGLSTALTDSLSTIAKENVDLLEPIQAGLLDLCAYAIVKKPFAWPAHSTSQAQHRKVSMSGQFVLPQAKLGQSFTILKDEESIFLALKTLETFEFEQGVLLEFTRETLVNFLDDDNPRMRMQAALTCAKQALNVEKKMASEMAGPIGEIIEKLLIVGIADPEPSIRKTVLSSFDERFDSFLAMAENLRSLFIALNDEIFEVREIAISIIGRLTIRNPAYVMPSLRKMLVQLLTELEFSGDSTNKEEAARLLGHLISSSRLLTKPYVNGIREALMPKLEEDDQKVASAVLGALGTLSRVAGIEMKQYIPRLMPFIIESFQDQSSVQKREVAVKTLGQLASSTAYVTQAYEDYPVLLDTLLNMIKHERSPSIRMEILRTLGMLGALDPYRHKVIQLTENRDEEHKEQDIATILEVLHMSPSDEAYCAGAAVLALIRILSDPSLSKYHRQVTEIIKSILEQLDLKEVRTLVPHIMPPYFKVMTNCDQQFRDFLFGQLADLVDICRDGLRDHLPRMFELIAEYWHTCMFAIIRLLEEISTKIPEDLKVHLPGLIPDMLSVLHSGDASGSWTPTQKVLHCLEVLGPNLDDYRHLVIPAIMRLVEQVYAPSEIRRDAILTIGRLAFQLDMADYASRISHPLARILEGNTEVLIQATMDCLCSLVYQLGADYAIVIPMVNKVIAKQKITHTTYEDLVSRLLKNVPMEKPQIPDYNADLVAITPVGLNISQGGQGTVKEKSQARAQRNALVMRSSGNFKNEIKRELRVNEQNLQKAWVTSQRTTKDDWMEWMRKFSVELVRETPSHSIRSCFSLAQVYHPLATELFNVAFLSCWNVMQEQFRDQLIQSLSQALLSEEIPVEISQIILNLAEFMERDGKPMPIESEMLGKHAEKCHAYAKALHYKELQFREQPTSENVEALISTYTHLQQPEAAVGILTYAEERLSMDLKTSWYGYEKLQRWSEALMAYNAREAQDDSNEDIKLGKMRCLYAVGDWEQLGAIVDQVWPSASDKLKSNMAPIAAATQWNLSKFDEMMQFVEVISANTYDGSFYRAVYAISKDQSQSALQNIQQARQALDGELTALLGESYNRAYEEMIKVQQLAEMEEIIEYKACVKDNPERSSAILQSWSKRLMGTEKNVRLWREMLSVRNLVIQPRDIPEVWLRFADLCRKNGRLDDAREVLQMLMSRGDVTARAKAKSPRFIPNPWVQYDDFRQQWAEGDKMEAYSRLMQFSSKVKDDPSLLARCNLKLGEWKIELSGLNESSIPQTLQSFQKATQLDPNSYKAWHKWSLTNFEVLSTYEKSANGVTAQQVRDHAIPAIHGFFRSIALCNAGQSLQDTLRLLTLWFRYGDRKEVEQALMEGFLSASIDTWLQVIPQIIARINAPSAVIRKCIQELLTTVSREHPQALVYPLTVAAQSQTATGKNAASAILEDMRTHSSTLVDQALLVSQELIRVSVIWHEMWHEALEEASRLYFNEHNPDAMIERLAINHTLLERGPQTILETQFDQSFRRDLDEAIVWTQKYKRTRQTVDLNQAWDLYYQVFKRLNKALGAMKSFDLEYVSPKLLSAMNLDLAVPGTYKASQPVIRIKSFSRKLHVISSKQRPRRTYMIGSDGRQYAFLLKGHEDLRQDERVMQLFGLVNTLFAYDNMTSRSHLSISRYSVIPLSPYSGLLGWVPNCDTLHGIIQSYRLMKKMEMNLEKKRIHMMSPHYETHSLIQKVEMFEYGIEGCNGDDVNHMLWLKSRNSESWIERRLTYIRSMGVMSMVGYILGLGDRHPSNLMLDRVTGKIIHIDFGDCFEVAMHRDKYPEKVPFRLTRMLINAMEAGGIEGNFRSTCENVMRVLHQNKESLMAVLEAFVHDPLINWRLLNTGNQPSHKDDDDEDPSTRDSRDSVSEDDSEMRSKADVDIQIREFSPTSGMGGKKPGAGKAMGALDGEQMVKEVLNERAVTVISRVEAKLKGTDFKPTEVLEVTEQVRKLIDQASSHENLCQSYQGWCPM